jgi:hypothetical protein
VKRGVRSSPKESAERQLKQNVPNERPRSVISVSGEDVFFNTSVGTYFSSLFWRTHSLSSAEPRYSPGEIFSSFTICSNELGEDVGGSHVSGFVKARLTERGMVFSPMSTHILSDTVTKRAPDSDKSMERSSHGHP